MFIHEHVFVAFSLSYVFFVQKVIRNALVHFVSDLTVLLKSMFLTESLSTWIRLPSTLVYVSFCLSSWVRIHPLSYYVWPSLNTYLSIMY